MDYLGKDYYVTNVYTLAIMTIQCKVQSVPCLYNLKYIFYMYGITFCDINLTDMLHFSH